MINCRVTNLEKKVTFKPKVYVTYVETNQEAEKGNFKVLHDNYKNAFPGKRLTTKGILKRFDDIHCCPRCREKIASDDYWYSNWKDDVQRSREKTNIWFWYRTARRYRDIEIFKKGLNL